MVQSPATSDALCTSLRMCASAACRSTSMTWTATPTCTVPATTVTRPLATRGRRQEIRRVAWGWRACRRRRTLCPRAHLPADTAHTVVYCASIPPFCRSVLSGHLPFACHPAGALVPRCGVYRPLALRGPPVDPYALERKQAILPPPSPLDNPPPLCGKSVDRSHHLHVTPFTRAHCETGTLSGLAGERLVRRHSQRNHVPVRCRVMRASYVWGSPTCGVAGTTPTDTQHTHT